MRKLVSEKPLLIAKRRPNSIATISAQPILWPSLSQTGISRQVSHSFPKTTPIPHEDDASTQNSIVEVGGGLAKEEPVKSADSCDRHHWMSDKTAELGDFLAKGDDEKLKDAARREKEGKCDRPSGRASEQCTRVPRTDSTSFLENFWVADHG